MRNVVTAIQRFFTPRMSITLNVIAFIVCTIGALLPPLNALSLINAACAGGALVMSITLLVDRARNRAFDAMSEAFFALSAMNDDLLARLHRKELGLDHELPASNHSTSLH